MNTEGNPTTKTGAIICVKKLTDSDELEYHALMFITDIPPDINDDQLKQLLGGHLNVLTENCKSVIVRADINSTSNEVAEQFNFHEDNAQRVPYESFA